MSRIIFILYAIWNYRKSKERFKKMQEIHSVSGVKLSYYSWFREKQGFYLNTSKLPSSVKWYNLTNYERLSRKTKRKVVQKVFGESMFARLNRFKKKFAKYLNGLMKKV